MLEAVATRGQQKQAGTDSRKIGNSKVTAAHATTANVKCAYCEGDHPIYQCKAFQGLSAEDRISQVKSKGLCLNCLRSKHFPKNCIAGNCKICGKRHSSLLHIETDKGKRNEDEQSSLKQEHGLSESNEKSNSASCHHTKIEEGTISRQVLLSTAEIRIRDKNGQFIECRASLDSGSQSNFISESCMDKLGLRYDKTQIEIHGINQQVSRALKVVDLEVTSRFGSFTTSLQCVVLPCITQNLPAVKISRSELDIPSNIRLADPEYYIPKEVDLLIGAEKKVLGSYLCRANKAR